MTVPNMRDIQWAQDPDDGSYDIINYFTDVGNEGNLEVIKSKILITLNTFQGEWAPQPNFGIPFQNISANSDNPDVLAQIIVNEILGVQNVSSVSIVSLDYVATNRQFSGTFTVNTVYGTTTITVG